MQYPSALLSYVFVSDGSGDKTAGILSAWCAGRPRACVHRSDTNLGKAASLNVALTGAGDEGLFVVYDADVVVDRFSVARLAEPFIDPAVGAVSGCTLPLGQPSGMSACYAALEAWMHNYVNQAAIDRLDLSPQINGSQCAFRLKALRKAGGWRVVEPATPFVPGWHIDAIIEHLEAITQGEIRNLVINVPPRHMKSLLVSVFWPAWEWIRWPERRWLFSSYGAQFAIR